MTTEDKNTIVKVIDTKPAAVGAAGEMEVSAEFSDEETASVEGGDVTFSTESEDTKSYDPNAPVEEEASGGEPKAEETAKVEEPKAETPKTDEVAQPLPDLGDYAKEKDKEFTARYVDNVGQLNMQALEAEVVANQSKDGKPSLNDNTYKFLEATRGIKKEDAEFFITKRIEEGQKVWNAFVTEIGGEDVLKKAQEWGTKNYSVEQRTKFNDALAKNDAKVLTEELELLVSRYNRAAPKTETAVAEEPKVKDFASSSAKTSSSAVEGYKTESEERKALKEINKIDDMGRKQRELKAHHAKVRNSEYYKNR